MHLTNLFYSGKSKKKQNCMWVRIEGRRCRRSRQSRWSRWSRRSRRSRRHRLRHNRELSRCHCNQGHRSIESSRSGINVMSTNQQTDASRARFFATKIVETNEFDCKRNWTMCRQCLMRCHFGWIVKILIEFSGLTDEREILFDCECPPKVVRWVVSTMQKAHQCRFNHPPAPQMVICIFLPNSIETHFESVSRKWRATDVADTTTKALPLNSLFTKSWPTANRHLFAYSNAWLSQIGW